MSKVIKKPTILLGALFGVMLFLLAITVQFLPEGTAKADTSVSDNNQPYSSGDPYPMDSASPTPSTSPSITPTPSSNYLSCDSLEITSGDKQLVPATVEFTVMATAEDSKPEEYRFQFGDGTDLKTNQNTVEHTYEVSGEFLVKAEVRDKSGQWVSSDDCLRTVTVRSSKVESHKSSCSDIYVTKENTPEPPTKVDVKVIGYDNKGVIQGYKIVWAKGEEEEHLSQDNEFSKTYQQAGTYVVQGYIKDSEGNWKGGEDCQETIYINTKPLANQPETGTPALMSAFSILSGATGLSLLKFNQKKK